ncbi:hypothetical protein [Oceanibaculum indicum]|uniref:DUF429 domain-containing protein n=1 Tax=Oceanibaculum indicum P24 TaxID=1207063 RepID=K2IU88_9PROT|nr:hypothetical protein [Oceanibaculum indicum]EKE73861.1 hypothetical protein P24_12082 [Oceanibaculum indicum P24]
MRERFDCYIGIDWSGAKGRYSGIALAECRADGPGPRLIAPEDSRWTRSTVADYLGRRIAAGERLLAGFDFAFGFPWIEGEGYLAGRTKHITDAFALWELIEQASAEAPDFHAGPLVTHPAFAPSYWVSGTQKPGWRNDKRVTETACGEATSTYPETVFKLIGAKQVGKAALAGIRTLRAIRRAAPAQVAVWPFEDADKPTVLAEIYPTLFRRQALGSTTKIKDRATLDTALTALESAPAAGAPERLTDHEGDALISAAGLRWLDRAGKLFTLPEEAEPQARREGWIVGV